LTNDSTHVERQLRKRFVLNLYIQGAAAHTWLTAHHLVRDELESLDPGIVEAYDKLAACLHLCQWQSDVFLFLGRPSRFWKGVDKPANPFSRQPIFRKYGRMLSEVSWEKARERSRVVGTATMPVFHYAQSLWMVWRVIKREYANKTQLERLCIEATEQIWGIDPARIRAKLTRHVAFGNLQTPRTAAGKLMRGAAAGYSGVVRDGQHLLVEARGWAFPLLAHELTKGTAELVCLHGLNQLDDQTFRQITGEADQIELEMWMMQAGGEIWRRFLSVIPRGTGNDRNLLASSLMHVALMEPETLEDFTSDVIEHPATARATLADLLDSAGGESTVDIGEDP
jgi:hypothetical protein